MGNINKVKTFLVQVDLQINCGDTLEYIVNEESEFLAKKVVLEDILKNKYNTTEYAIQSNNEFIEGLREDIITEYDFIFATYDEEQAENYLDLEAVEFKTNENKYDFKNRDFISNYDYVKEIALESSRLQSYEYAADFAVVTEITKDTGIKCTRSIYNGC